MAEDPKPAPTPEAPKNGNGNIVKLITGAVALDWVRPLIFKVGGRKAAIGGAALYVIREITAADHSDLVKVGASAAAAVVAVGIAWTIGSEDAKKKEPK